MEPVEKDRIIEIQQNRIEHLLNRTLRLEAALMLWVKFWKADGDEDPLLAEEAMEETRAMLGDNI
jgi:hypothetical protein